jgi:transcriptional regulator with AAA-type ATPase domain/tetratricopeptide (TPR) repeat protein
VTDRATDAMHGAGIPPAAGPAGEPSLADFYLSAGDLLLAEDAYTAELAAAAPGERAALLRKIGGCRERRGEHEAAMAALADAQRAAMAADDPLEAARADLLLGKIHFHRGDLPAAFAQADAARNILRQHGNIADRGLAENLLGGIAYRRGDLELARRHFEKSVYLGKQGGDFTLLARGYNNLGLIHKELGDWDQATDCFQSSLGLDGAAANFDARTTAWINLGILHQKRSEWQAAMAVFRRAAKLCRQTGHPLGIVRSLLGMAAVHRGRGDFPGGERAAAEAAAIADRHGYSRELALAEAIRGWMALDRGDLGGAADHLARARTAAGAVGESGDLAPHLIRLAAQLALSRGEAAEAHALATGAASTARAAGDRYELASLERITGEALARLGRPAEAAAALERAVRALRRMGERQELGRALLAWSGVLEANEPRGVVERIHEARALLTEIEDRPGRVLATIALARHYHRHGWEQEALAAAQEAWEALDALAFAPALAGELEALQRTMEAEVAVEASAAASRSRAGRWLAGGSHWPLGEANPRQFLEELAERLGADAAAILPLAPLPGKRPSAGAVIGLRAPEREGLLELAPRLTRELERTPLLYALDVRGSDLFRGSAFARLRPVLSVILAQAFGGDGEPWLIYLDRARGGAERRPFERRELALAAALGPRFRALVESLAQGGPAGALPLIALGAGTFVAESPLMREILARLARIQASSIRVLLQGETGTGKGQLARILHLASPRANRAFRVLNCAALPESLLESELFGHVKGSFTGAIQDKVGLLEEANGGTIFLDDIEKAGPSVQRGLLHFLDGGEIRPVGSTKRRQIDVRVICATSSPDLTENVRTGTFYKDLYYRLEHFTVTVPPLRRRQEDILHLARHFLARFTAEFGGGPSELDPQVASRLIAYEWPGNVRELENVIRRGVVLGGDQNVLTLPLLPDALAAVPVGRDATAPIRLSDLVEGFEAEQVRAALTAFSGNKTRAALALGLTRKGLRNKIRRYHLG